MRMMVHAAGMLATGHFHVALMCVMCARMMGWLHYGLRSGLIEMIGINILLCESRTEAESECKSK
jgi:hypothetical protein